MAGYALQRLCRPTCAVGHIRAECKRCVQQHLGAFAGRGLLSITVLCWGAAMVLSGVATSFEFPFSTRLALGIVTAVAGPAVPSLIGDYFPEQGRGRIYGFVLSGELIGAGFGFVVAGQFALLSWRAPFLALQSHRR